MRQNAEKAYGEGAEDYPRLTVVGGDSEKAEAAPPRPELEVLGWEPRARRLASRSSAGGKR